MSITIRQLIGKTIPEFFKNTRVRIEILKLIKAAGGSSSITSDQISDATQVGKDILTAEDSNVVKDLLDIEPSTPDFEDINTNSGSVVGNNALPIRASGGTWIGVTASQDYDPNTLAWRDANGNIQSTDPLTEQDVATKNYVDSSLTTIDYEQVVENSGLEPFSNMVLGLGTGNAPIRLAFSPNVVNSSLAYRTATGTLKASDPTATDDLTTKSYVDGQLTSKLTGTQGSAVADATDATDVVTQFNALLASLRTAGIIAQ